jgi:acetoin:2,6-dichlorophenolindophenol oxidoreductase subunit alpha
LAMGGEPARLLGELMGRQIGYCRGRGGSQHISAPGIGLLGTNGITGGGIPIATGAALSAKLLHTGAAVICFFGDGATNQGTFHESLNMAALWKLPVLYVCENNRYAMSEPVCRTIAGGDILPRARAYGIPAECVDGMDVEAVEQAAGRALAAIRAGKGPSFIEAATYRFCGHSKSDKLVYRTREEEAQWRERDPLTVARLRLEKRGCSEALAKVEEEVRRKLTEAEETSRNAPPTPPETSLQGVYADA